MLHVTCCYSLVYNTYHVVLINRPVLTYPIALYLQSIPLFINDLPVHTIILVSLVGEKYLP